MVVREREGGEKDREGGEKDNMSKRRRDTGEGDNERAGQKDKKANSIRYRKRKREQ